MSEPLTSDMPSYAIVNGAHCFQTGVDGHVVTIDLALTGRQIQFLAENPAAVRACLSKGWFSLGWLEALMDQVEILNRGPTSEETWH